MIFGRRRVAFSRRTGLRARRSMRPHVQGRVAGRRWPPRLLRKCTGGDTKECGKQKQKVAHDRGLESKFCGTILARGQNDQVSPHPLPPSKNPKRKVTPACPSDCAQR